MAESTPADPRRTIVQVPSPNLELSPPPATVSPRPGPSTLDMDSDSEYEQPAAEIDLDLPELVEPEQSDPEEAMDVTEPPPDPDVSAPDLSDLVNPEESYDANPPPQDESSLDEPELEPEEAESFELTWEIIEGATERGGAHLVNNIGYQYVQRRPPKNGTTYWVCSKKTMGCRASVIQKNGGFIVGPAEHICAPRTGLGCAAKVRATVNKAAKAQPFTSARQIVDGVSITSSGYSYDYNYDYD